MKALVKPRWLIAGVAASVLFVTPAQAQWFGLHDQCSTGTIQTCASFEIQTLNYTTSGQQRTQVYLRVRNMFALLADGSEGGSILTRLGVLSPELVDARNENFLNTAQGSIFAEDPATRTGTPENYWEYRNNLNSLGQIEWGLSTQNANGGIRDCIGPDANPSSYFNTCAGGWVTFAFTAAGDLNPEQFQIAWGVVSVSSDGQGSGDLGSFQGQTEVVPEPITLTLLGTGLLGIGGAGAIRRRRQRQGEEHTLG
ncbi:MAG: PEP-CTERM sorting domain-containing protein [Longimicrobiales bacterium]